MDDTKGLLKLDQALPFNDVLGQRARQFVDKPVDDRLDEPSEGPLMKSFRLRIDGNDPLEVEVVLFDITLHDLDIGVMDLFLLVKPPHLSGKDQCSPLLEPISEISLMTVKPLQCDDTASVSHHSLEDPFTADSVKGRAGHHDLAVTGLSLSSVKLRDLLQVASIFVTSGKKVEGILHGPNPLLLEEFGEFWTDTLDVLYGR